MQLIQAIAKSAPRQVNTRYGQKTVIDAVSHDGQEITIWRGGNDCSPALNSITNGSRISVGLASNGKYSACKNLINLTQSKKSLRYTF
jgi:general stress protein 26